MVYRYHGADRRLHHVLEVDYESGHTDLDLGTEQEVKCRALGVFDDCLLVRRNPACEVETCALQDESGGKKR